MQSDLSSEPPPLTGEAPPPMEATETLLAYKVLIVASRVLAGIIVLLCFVLAPIVLTHLSIGAAVVVVLLVGAAWFGLRRFWPSWWLVGAGYVLLVAAGIYVFGDAGPEIRRSSLHKSVRTYQLRAAFDMFLIEHPDRIFVRFEDLVGPGAYMQAAPPVDGEDYRAMFPLRCDASAMPVTFGDGWQVILFRGHLIVRRPSGRYVDRHLRFPEAVEEYKRFLAEQRQPDGVHTTTVNEPSALNGRRFETSYRGGLPDGPFRAFYPGGRLWGEATYRQGRLVGRHRVFSSTGKVVFETDFGP